MNGLPGWAHEVFSARHQSTKGNDGMQRLVEQVVQEVLATEKARFLEAEPCD